MLGRAVRRSPISESRLSMKRTLWTMAALMGAVIWTTGCNTGTPGGPGTEKDKENKSTLQKAEDMVIQPEGTYSLTTPFLATRIKQGESKEVAVGIRRGKNFDEDVAIKFDDVPQGVTIDPRRRRSSTIRKRRRCSSKRATTPPLANSRSK